MRGLLLVAAVGCGVAVGFGTGVAQEVTQATRRVEILAQQNKFVEALEALDQVTEALWSRAPLAFRQALWVKERAGGFGIFTPREDDEYDAGTVQIAYAEPIGFGWRRTGDFWRTDMTADLIILTEDGREVFTQDNYLDIAIESRVRIREFSVHLSYTLRGISPGNYRVETRLRDAVTGKTGSFTLPFTIR